MRGEIIAMRQFNSAYIWLDIAFLALLIILLFKNKKYMTIIVGLAAGVLYMLVDYGIFHLALHSRSINQGHSMFFVLLWMSMSYGFTNFSWIWLWISKDKNLREWSFLILMWWFCCPLLANTFGSNTNLITIQRTTSEYHGYMALILFVGYLAIIIWNIKQRDKKRKIPIFWLLAIGILVQFGWELGLLVGGIRSTGIVSFGDKIKTLIVNSLLETNLGMPYIYALYIMYSSRYTEELKKKNTKLKFVDSIEENNNLNLI